MVSTFAIFACSGDPRDLHSFPTRRSSDLLRRRHLCRRARQGNAARPDVRRGGGAEKAAAPVSAGADPRRGADRDQLDRSEEHTSELQSLRQLVCRLLLEKKNWIASVLQSA